MNLPQSSIGECDHRRVEEYLSQDGDGTDDQLIAHLDACEACRQYMEEAAATADLREMAANVLQPSEFDSAGSAACCAATVGMDFGSQATAVQDALDTLSPSEHPHHLGRVGLYEITGVIGVGAMGVVLKAIDPSLDRVVALKMMAPRLANNDTARKRFLREAKAAAAVLHPNVIPIHGVSSDSRIPYLVMSYVRGGSLQKRLQSGGPLPLLEILRIGAQIAAGLEAAHEKGLVHRDIKPENVLLEEGVERVTITDFGLARAVDDNTVTQHGTIAGTPMYMSPEQARGESVDQQSDLFSLGSVLYALCTGRPPYHGDTSYGVMRRIIDEQPVAIQNLSPETPDWFVAIVDRLMAKSKSDRFHSAAEVHHLLDACLRHVHEPTRISLPEIPGIPSAATDKIAQRKRTRIRIAVLTGIAAISLFIMAAFAFFQEPVDSPYMIGGGNAVRNENWFFSSGQIYLQKDEPGVLFGMHEDPQGQRKLSYVVLFRHQVDESTQVQRPTSNGISFDGTTAQIKDGITIGGVGLRIGLKARLNDSRTAIESTNMTFDGEEIDGSAGRLLLVDLTSNPVKYSQVKAKLPTELPTPNQLVHDQETVAKLAHALMQFDGVRKYLEEQRSPTSVAYQNETTNQREETASAEAPSTGSETAADAGPKAPETAGVEDAARTKNEQSNTQQFLLDASRRGDLVAVKAALAAGVKPNGFGNQLTPLHWAATQRIADGQTIEPSPEIVKVLIEAGADVNASDYLGQTPLEWASSRRAVSIVKMLIEAGADVNAESRYGTVLNAARDVEIAKLLLDAGADVNAGKIIKPLANATKNGNAALMKLLIDRGAIVNDVNDPPLHWAGTPEAASALLKADADVNLTNRKGETALHLTHGTWSPNAATVKLLIESGADVRAVNQLGLTPLHSAIRQVDPDIASILIANGAELDARDKQGNTPLSMAHVAVAWARDGDQVDVAPYETNVRQLIDAGAMDDGRTELQRAVFAGDLPSVTELLAKGVDVNETGPQRITAVHLASESGNEPILDALLRAGAKPDSMDARRYRPLHLAANAKVAKLLIENGAATVGGLPSPIYMAVSQGRVEVVQVLLDEQAITSASGYASLLNWSAFYGQTEIVRRLFQEHTREELIDTTTLYSPLHVVTSGALGDVASPKRVTPEKRLEIAKLLVENGVRVDTPWGQQIDQKSSAAPMIGTTPLMFAASKGETAMVDFLIREGADANARNANKETALHWATSRGYAPVVKRLLEAQADVNALSRDAKTPLDLAQDATVKVLLMQNGGTTANQQLKESAVPRSGK